MMTCVFFFLFLFDDIYGAEFYEFVCFVCPFLAERGVCFRGSIKNVTRCALHWGVLVLAGSTLQLPSCVLIFAVSIPFHGDNRLAAVGQPV